MAIIDGDQLNIKKWIVFYPVYVNSKKTIAEGRRIGVSKACENPTCVEIVDCCKHLKLPCAIEILGYTGNNDSRFLQARKEQHRIGTLLHMSKSPDKSIGREWCLKRLSSASRRLTGSDKSGMESDENMELFIRSGLQGITSWSISFCRKSANQVAHELAAFHLPCETSFEGFLPNNSVGEKYIMEICQDVWNTN